MSRYDLYVSSLITGTLLILLGIYYQVRHLPGSGDILGTGLLISLYWFISGLAGILRSSHLSGRKRAGWILFFLFLPWIAGVTYYLREMKPEKAAGKDHEKES